MLLVILTILIVLVVIILVLLLKFKKQGGYILKCSDGYKICPLGTNYMGLCIEESRDCNEPYENKNIHIPNLDFEIDDAILKAQYDIGVKRYKPDNLTNFCGNITKMYEEIHNGDLIPENFSILTLNVMGINRSQDEDKIKFIEKRANMLCDNIMSYDILCFQEMSHEFYNVLKSRLNYKFFQNLDNILLNNKMTNDVDVCIISKYEPEKIEHFYLDGCLNYKLSIERIEFKNLVIFNIYLQAGSVFSQGQIIRYMHFARCRIQQLQAIENLVKNEKKPFIILGDFNFDLNNTQTGIWPEYEYMLDFKSKYNINDVLSSGFTEDTDINTMRYNNKLEEKMLRFDTMLYKSLTCISSEIICNKPVELFDNENKIYEKLFIPTSPEDPRIRRNKNKNYDLFISDHFGVLSKLKF